MCRHSYINTKQMKYITIDDDPERVPMDEFIKDNEELTEEELKDLNELEVGESVLIGFSGIKRIS